MENGSTNVFVRAIRAYMIFETFIWQTTQIFSFPFPILGFKL